MEQSSPEQQHPVFTSRDWLILSVVSALVYVSAAYSIFYFFLDTGLSGAFDSRFSFPMQLVTGVGLGLLFSGIVYLVMGWSLIAEVVNDFHIIRIISRTKLSLFDRLQISFFAGAGEELLFRGAIQPLLGIWVTSVIFIGLHGYFKWNSVGHILFGVMMFLLSVGLGFIYEWAGLIAAMSAHFAYDVVMLRIVQKNDGSEA